MLNHQIVQTERLILQALCRGLHGAPRPEKVWRRLETHRWLEPEHEVIFAALVSLRRASSPVIQELLSQRLTRMGFPDLVLDDLFQPHACSAAELEAAIGWLERSE